jgi:hypothetical protein
MFGCYRCNTADALHADGTEIAGVKTTGLVEMKLSLMQKTRVVALSV